MIDRFERRFHRFDRRHDGSGRAGDHDNLDTEQACGLDLGIGRRAAAVLGDDGIDTMLPHQVDFALEREGTTVEDVVDIDKGKRRIDGIDAAHQIEMLWGDLGVMGALTAGRQKDAARGGAKCRNRRRDIRSDMPVIARFGHPFRANEGERADTRAFRSNRGIGRNAFGEGMGGIDQQVIASSRQEVYKPLRTTEAADTDGNRLLGGSLRAARQRQENVELFPRGKFFGKPARLAGSAEDQNTGLLHV